LSVCLVQKYLPANGELIDDDSNFTLGGYKSFLLEPKVRFCGFWNIIFNPNPHGFIVITKPTACGFKEPLLLHPLPGTVGERGRGMLAAQLLQ
jgi:hypothetical protein